MQITFITNPIKELKSDDSTMQILEECMNRGHQTFVVDRNNLFLYNCEIYANAYRGEDAYHYFSSKDSLQCVSTTKINLSKNDAIMMRQDPPFDEDFIYITYLLELIKDKVFIMNDPTSVRNANEKFFPMQFKEYMPETLITKSPEEIKNFMKAFKDGIVIKPLNNRGGAGIFYITQKDLNQNEIIKVATDNGTKFVMIQKFLKEIKDGDKRLTILNGECINSFVRIPAKGDFRGNMCSGASAKKTNITKEEQKMLDKIGPVLKNLGIYLAGIDIIGGYITEINTTSPVIANSLYPGTAGRIVDFIEKRLVVSGKR